MPSRFRVLLAELKRRHVTRTAVGYLVIGFAVIEAADNLQGTLNLSDSVVGGIAILIIAGFPVVLALAWAFDITSEGIQKTKDLPDSKLSPWERSALLKKPGVLGPILVVALAGAVSVLVWSVLQPSGPRFDQPQYVDSVAVMPLDNYTGNPGYDHIGMGMAEEIIAQLSQIRSLKVISRHSVQVLSGLELTTPELADTLGVRHIVEGSIRIDADGMLRTTLQHIDAFSDAHLWSEHFEGDTSDIIALEKEVARRVTGRVIEFIPGVTEMPELPAAQGEPGLGPYQLGKYWLGRRTPQGFTRAIAQFHRALADNPRHPQALADLSSAYALALNYRYDVGEEEWVMAARSLAAAELAITLAPELGAGYAARGYLRAIAHAPIADVAEDFQRAAELQPNAASIPSWSARVLAMQGREEEAFYQALRAVDLDPFAAGRHIAVASLSVHLGRYNQAIQSGEMAAELEPEVIMGLALAARARLLSGRPDLCADSNLGPHAAVRATCLHELGREEEAQALVDSMAAEAGDGGLDDSTFTNVIRLEDLAVYYAWTGNAQESLAWIRRALDSSPAGFELRLYESALFDGVRSEAGFDDEVRELYRSRYERVRRESRDVSFE